MLKLLKVWLFALLMMPLAALAQVSVNINTATVEQLQTVKGIGPTRAQAIVTYREQNGKFKNLEDLKNVKGLGDKSFAKIKDQVSISGASRAGVSKSTSNQKEVKEVKKANTKASNKKSDLNQKATKTEENKDVKKTAKSHKAKK